MPTAAWQNTLPTPSPGPWNCPHQARPGSAILPCPRFPSAPPAAAGLREVTRGQGKAAALSGAASISSGNLGDSQSLQELQARLSDPGVQIRFRLPPANSGPQNLTGLSRGLAVALPHSAVGRNRPSRGLKDQGCARSTRPSCKGRSPAGRRAVAEPGEGSNSLGGRGLGRVGEARAHSIKKIK